MGVYRKQGAWWIDWYEGRRRLGKKTPARTKTEAKKLLEKFKVPSFKESPRVSAGPGFKRTGTSSRGELDDARHYEELSSPFEAARIVLQPLRAERLVPGKVIPPLRLSAARAERCLFVVPTMDGKMAEQCTPGWAGSAPRARCVMERRREILGGDPAFAVGDCLSLIW